MRNVSSKNNTTDEELNKEPPSKEAIRRSLSYKEKFGMDVPPELIDCSKPELFELDAFKNTYAKYRTEQDGSQTFSVHMTRREFKMAAWSFGNGCMLNSTIVGVLNSMLDKLHVCERV